MKNIPFVFFILIFSTQIECMELSFQAKLEEAAMKKDPQRFSELINTEKADDTRERKKRLQLMGYPDTKLWNMDGFLNCEELDHKLEEKDNAERMGYPGTQSL